jgi:hypothetical protein
MEALGMANVSTEEAFDEKNEIHKSDRRRRRNVFSDIRRRMLKFDR